MQEDPIIQKSLIPIINENNSSKEIKEITEDLTNENLNKESQKRPRHRKNSTNLVNKFKDNLISESKKGRTKVLGSKCSRNSYFSRSRLIVWPPALRHLIFASI